jgi:hypothetical protein
VRRLIACSLGEATQTQNTTTITNSWQHHQCTVAVVD